MECEQGRGRERERAVDLESLGMACSQCLTSPWYKLLVHTTTVHTFGQGTSISRLAVMLQTQDRTTFLRVVQIRMDGKGAFMISDSNMCFMANLCMCFRSHASPYSRVSSGWADTRRCCLLTACLAACLCKAGWNNISTLLGS